MELMVAFVIFGIIFSGAASLFNTFEKENALLNRRIQSAALEANLMMAFRSPDLIRELILDAPRNRDLLECLQEGCPVENRGSVSFNSEFDWALRGFDLKGSYLVRGPDLIEVDLELSGKLSTTFHRNIKIYLPRRDYLDLPKHLTKLKCGHREYLNGVRYKTWQAICKSI